MQRAVKKIKNIFKKHILQNDNDVIESLTNKEIDKINRIKQETEMLKATEEAKKQKYETETNIQIHQTEQDKRKIEADTNILKFQVSNINLKCKQAKQKRALKFFDTKNEVLEKEMENYKKIGEKQSNGSLWCTILSALTTCMGLYTFFNPDKLLSTKTFLTIFTIGITVFVAYTANNYLQYLSIYIQKFYDSKSENEMKKTFQKSAVSFYTFIICTYTIYSIITNYMFWTVAELGTVPTLILACILDFMSVGLALTAPDFQTLNVNSEYKKEITESVESVNKNVNKSVSKTVTTLDKQGSCDTLENVEKRKRKGNIKNKITQKEFDKKVLELDEGTKLSPKIFDMSDVRYEFYKMCERCSYVEKINGSYYRVENESVKFEVL